MSLEQTHRRRQAVATIHDIVSAMRAIAAGRIQGAQRALASSRRYQQVVLRAMTALCENGLEKLPLSNGHDGKKTLLVFTSEQPLCGAFNQNVLAFAEQHYQKMRAEGELDLIVVGRRGDRQLRSRGIVPDFTEAAATTLQGLRDLVKRLATLVDRRYAAGQLGELHVIYSRYQSISEQIPTQERLLPPEIPDPEDRRSSQDRKSRGVAEPSTPVVSEKRRYHRYLPLSTLLAGVLSEYAFINLYRMAADSYTSEQASRLLAMDGATRNTERLGQALLDLERRERQGEITRQVLELISGRIANG